MEGEGAVNFQRRKFESREKSEKRAGLDDDSDFKIVSLNSYRVFHPSSS